MVTFTSDVEDTKRLCFVGQNGVQCGRAAAGLMGELTGGKGKKKDFFFPKISLWIPVVFMLKEANFSPSNCGYL